MCHDDVIAKQIDESIELKRFLKEKTEVISAIARQITDCLRSGNKVLLCGNGGSAADAQHLAAELAGKFYRVRAPLPAIALTTNTSILTALANDFSYDEVFARQVQALAAPGDVVVGISTSGNSPNVVMALQEARRRGAVTIAFTGDGGRMTELADLCLEVPSGDTPRIQETHITAGHIICYLVEEDLFGEASLG